MAASKQTRGASARYEDLLIRIKDFDLSASGGLNFAFLSPNLMEFHSEHELAIDFTFRLELHGTVLLPTQRKDHNFQLNLVGNDHPDSFTTRTLKDYQVRDKYGAPVYRLYRGRRIPTFDPPLGIGHIDKVRGENSWTGFVFTPTSFLTQAVHILEVIPQVFLMIRERTENRKRVIQSFSIQSDDDM